MSIPVGSYTLGPEQATLTVATERTGAAAKAGHDLLIEVTNWSASLRLAEDRSQSSLTLDADAGSLRVLEGTGGIQALGEDDKRGITQTIGEEVLRGGSIRFVSGSVAPGPNGGPLAVVGELELLGARAPLSFELVAGDDGQIDAAATVKQSDWGIKPYSALFGTLKVRDEVQVRVQGTLPAA